MLSTKILPFLVLVADWAGIASWIISFCHNSAMRTKHTDEICSHLESNIDDALCQAGKPPQLINLDHPTVYEELGTL